MDKSKRLSRLAKDIKSMGRVGSFDLDLNNINNGCFARAHLIGEFLKEEGFEVHYVRAYPVPIFRYHTAAAVTVDGKEYIIDPLYSNKPLSSEEWAAKQTKNGGTVYDLPYRRNDGPYSKGIERKSEVNEISALNYIKSNNEGIKSHTIDTAPILTIKFRDGKEYCQKYIDEMKKNC